MSATSFTMAKLPAIPHRQILWENISIINHKFYKKKNMKIPLKTIIGVTCSRVSETGIKIPTSGWGKYIRSNLKASLGL